MRQKSKNAKIAKKTNEKRKEESKKNRRKEKPYKGKKP